MAPLLMSVPEHQQVELPILVTMSKKVMKPVIPAVPRVFEKRRVTGNVETPYSGSVIGEQNERKGDAFQSSAEDTPVMLADQHTPKSSHEQDPLRSWASHYVLKGTAIVENQGTSYSI